MKDFEICTDKLLYKMVEVSVLLKELAFRWTFIKYTFI
jgi:hypothetical protein